MSWWYLKHRLFLMAKRASDIRTQTRLRQTNWNHEWFWRFLYGQKPVFLKHLWNENFTYIPCIFLRTSLCWLSLVGNSEICILFLDFVCFAIAVTCSNKYLMLLNFSSVTSSWAPSWWKKSSASGFNTMVVVRAPCNITKKQNYPTAWKKSHFNSLLGSIVILSKKILWGGIQEVGSTCHTCAFGKHTVMYWHSSNV